MRGQEVFSRWARNEEQSVLRTANVLVRALVLLLVGLSAFTKPWPGTAAGVLQIAAFAVATVLVLLHGPIDRPPPPTGRYTAALPYTLAVISVLCGVTSALPTGGLFVILGVTAAISAATDTSPKVSCATVSLGVIGTVVAGLVLGANASVTVEYPIVLVLGLVVGHNLRAYRLKTEQSERLRAEQARAATLDERARIAREVHDVLAHSLGALGLQIQLARAVLTDQHDEARAIAVLEQAQRMATDGLVDTRRAVHALRGQTLPLAEGLAQLIDAHQRRYRSAVTFAVHGTPRPLGPDAELALTRAAQEALVNTAKHAPHQPVAVRLDYAESATNLRISNDLAGERPVEGEPRLTTVNGHYGLAGMRERLLLLRGTLAAGRQGSVWVVTAWVPQ